MSGRNPASANDFPSLFDPRGNCPWSGSLHMHRGCIRKLYYRTYFAGASTESERLADFLKGTEMMKPGFGIRPQVFRLGEESSRIGSVERLATGVSTCPSPLCIDISVTGAWVGVRVLSKSL